MRLNKDVRSAIETDATLVYRLCVVLLVGHIHFTTTVLHYLTVHGQEWCSVWKKVAIFYQSHATLTDLPAYTKHLRSNN